MSPSAATRVNTLLVLLAGVLSGIILGYVLGHSSGNGLPASAAPRVQLNDVLAEEDAWIVEGLTCPMPGCTNPLLVCQSDISRRIRDWVNGQRTLGRPGESIRAEIIRKHGQTLFKRGFETQEDSSVLSAE